MNSRQRRAAAWDAPYAGTPSYLPSLAGTFSWTNEVTDDGTVGGPALSRIGSVAGTPCH